MTYDAGREVDGARRARPGVGAKGAEGSTEQPEIGEVLAELATREPLRVAQFAYAIPLSVARREILYLTHRTGGANGHSIFSSTRLQTPFFAEEANNSVPQR